MINRVNLLPTAIRAGMFVINRVNMEQITTDAALGAENEKQITTDVALGTDNEYTALGCVQSSGTRMKCDID